MSVEALVELMKPANVELLGYGNVYPTGKHTSPSVPIIRTSNNTVKGSFLHARTRSSANNTQGRTPSECNAIYNQLVSTGKTNSRKRSHATAVSSGGRTVQPHPASGESPLVDVTTSDGPPKKRG